MQIVTISLVVSLTTPGGAPKEVTTPMRLREIIEKMQETHASIFHPRACYDGAKNMYTTLDLKQENVSVITIVIQVHLFSNA